MYVSSIKWNGALPGCTWSLTCAPRACRMSGTFRQRRRWRPPWKTCRRWWRIGLCALFSRKPRSETPCPLLLEKRFTNQNLTELSLCIRVRYNVLNFSMFSLFQINNSSCNLSLECYQIVLSKYLLSNRPYHWIRRIRYLLFFPWDHAIDSGCLGLVSTIPRCSVIDIHWQL